MPTAGVAILVTVSLAAWLRSRRTQPLVDAQTARRLAQRSGPEARSAPSASDIVIGDLAVARSSS